MAQEGLTPSSRQEADAILHSMRMAERHQRWDMFEQLLLFVEDAGGRVSYQGPGTYALEVP